MPTDSVREDVRELVKGEPELQVSVNDLEGGDQFANLEGADRQAWDRDLDRGQGRLSAVRGGR